MNEFVSLKEVKISKYYTPLTFSGLTIDMKFLLVKKGIEKPGVRICLYCIAKHFTF